MKHTITTRLAALLLFAAGMAGCSEEDTLPGGNATTPDSDRCPMTVSVADGGYTAIHPSAPGTRAAEDGYATRFTAGDRIGLYAVKDGNITASNVCLTATESGSGGGLGNGIAWQVPEGTTLYYEGKGTKYFAYYPYQSALTGSPTPSATDASGFFANVVSAWTPATDQSTYARYTASDLMTGSGILGSKQADGTYSLSFTLAHALALVVIETPTTKYTLANASNNSLPDYYIPAPGTRFYGFTPYSPSVGTYRYLVKPLQSSAADLMGSYAATAVDGTTATKEYAVTQNHLTAASYVFYKVDNATVTEKQHTLQAGDFYLSDGSLVSKDVENLSDAQKQACLGIVMKAGKDDSGDWADTDTYTDKAGNTMSTIHGYVLALYDANGGCDWGSSHNEVVGTNRQKETLFCGYSNTQTIKSYASSNSKNLQSDYPAAYHASVGYETAYPAPTNSSGWFLPSAGQCWYWHQNKDVLKSSMDKAGGNGWQYYFWSSSEDSDYTASCARYVRFHYYSDMSVGNKGNNYSVRSCLAF